VAGAGNLERGAAARQGGKLGEDGAFSGLRQDLRPRPYLASQRHFRPDSWNSGQAGFRADWGTAAGAFTLQGEHTAARSIRQPPAISGSRAETCLPAGLGSSREATGCRSRLISITPSAKLPGTFAERLNTLDVEFQHALRVGQQHSVIWGGGYRRADDHIKHNRRACVPAADRNLRWGNLFAQDELLYSRSTAPDARCEGSEQPVHRHGVPALGENCLETRRSPARVECAIACRPGAGPAGQGAIRPWQPLSSSRADPISNRRSRRSWSSATGAAVSASLVLRHAVSQRSRSPAQPGARAGRCAGDRKQDGRKD